LGNLVENEFAGFWRQSAAGSVLMVNKKRVGHWDYLFSLGKADREG
jgi:hypothetical protein